MTAVCKTEHRFRGGIPLGRTHIRPVVGVRKIQKDAAVDIAANFGRNLARCRKRAKLSQEELAVRASLHRTAVGQLERGERVARVDTLIKLAGSLGIPPGELLDGMGWAPGGTTMGQFEPQEVSDREEVKQAA
ncbi:MAG TPA: helix-turn-helix transcriptional regulator [Solirubrobacterales bacterium]|nr:helix-turn-helix transcriptional regulator [Solirubrobacterales bacterium]